MATNISAFRTEVDYYVKKASSDTTFLDDQIVKVIRDFCSKTWLWRQTLTAVNTVLSTSEYTPVIPTTDGEAELHMVDWVKWKENGADDDQWKYLNPIVIEDEEQPGATYVGPNFINESGDSPDSFWVTPEDTIVINPTPNSSAVGTSNLQFKVIVKPIIDSATKVPDFFYDDWLEVICQGVAGRILNMAAKKWYNPTLSDRYWMQYTSARDYEAKAQRWKGKNRAKSHVRVFPAFSGGSRSRGTTQFF